MILEDMEAIEKGRNDIVYFVEEILGCELNPFQKRVIKETCDINNWSDQNLVIAANRSGKTILLSFKHLWFAFYKIGMEGNPKMLENAVYRTFAISPVSRQSKEVIRTVEQILGGVFTWERGGKRYSNGTKLRIRNFLEGINKNLGEIRYKNNSLSYCFSTSEDQGSGFQGLPAGYISYDECVEDQHLQNSMASMVSRLGDYGQQFDLITTPNANPDRTNAQQELYHMVQECREGQSAWKLVGGQYDENFFISRSKRERQKKRVRNISPKLYNQIIKGEFVVVGKKMFDMLQIEQIFDKNKKGETSAELGSRYVMIADWGFADKGDETVIGIFKIDMKPYELVFAHGEQGADPQAKIAQCQLLKEAYNDCAFVHDKTSLGGTIMKKMMKSMRPIDFNGVKFKSDALFHLQVLLSENRKQITVNGKTTDHNKKFGVIRSYYISKLSNQLSMYQYKDTKLKQDWVSMLYMFAWYIRHKEPLARPRVWDIHLYGRRR